MKYDMSNSKNSRTYLGLSKMVNSNIYNKNEISNKDEMLL